MKHDASPGIAIHGLLRDVERLFGHVNFNRLTPADKPPVPPGGGVHEPPALGGG